MNRIVYLHGFASSPRSKKALWFAERFRERGIAFDIPDLAAGDFEHLTIGGQLGVIEETCRGESVVLMGSSLGGYLASLYAASHPEVARLILMAPAFRFAKRLMQHFGPAKFLEWRGNGLIPVFHYGEGRELPLRHDLITEGVTYPDFPSFQQPALVFHGIQDASVPWSLSWQFAQSHPNVRLWLADSGHELTDVLDMMWDASLDFLGLDGSECANENEWLTT